MLRVYSVPGRDLGLYVAGGLTVHRGHQWGFQGLFAEDRSGHRGRRGAQVDLLPAPCLGWATPGPLLNHSELPVVPETISGAHSWLSQQTPAGRQNWGAEVAASWGGGSWALLG